ncbi:MAG: T9SS type A sorting domain-containing protein [Ignavibacteriae bacterium]|nr:T9SS type A sorting domain-containing protein [Ignavibacteriota bacterium]
MKSKIFLLASMIMFTSNLLIYPYNDSLKKIKKTNIKAHYSKFNINNISTFIYNDGNSDIHPNGNSGLEYPIGSNKAVVFESGLVWGGKVNGKILVGGSTYSQGLYGGKVLESGNAQDPNDEKVRVYRVRPDYKFGNISNEILDEKKSEREIRNQYAKDWYDWPAEDGAPFKDVDNNGNYNPEIDIPGIPGASQTLWYVANDLDSNRAKELYGSPTMGMEMQVTIWGYKNIDVLEKLFFKKFILINKSKNIFEEMYVSQWCDPDVGYAGDDYVGCDTNLNLGFAYNGELQDDYYGYEVPAVGFNILQGPIVKGNSTDIAKFNGKILNGYKNLKMTSFVRLLKNFNSGFDDPDIGDYDFGTLQFYKIMQALDVFGNLILDPLTNKPTKYSVPGDPVNKIGWYESIDKYGPADRRLAINSGPFTIAPGDTQEVIIAEIVAGGNENIDRLQAITSLKNNCEFAEYLYENDFRDLSQLVSFPIELKKIELDKQIILTWYDSDNVSKIENYDSQLFKFQGYTIYQFPNRNFVKEEAKVVGNFDIIDEVKNITSEIYDEENNFYSNKVLKIANDSGIKRHILIEYDKFSGKYLNNGTEYYFGISFYLTNKNILNVPKIIESEIYTLSAIPQVINSVEYYGVNYGDTIYNYTDPEKTINIISTIANPESLIENEYKISFNINDFWSKTTWDLIDKNGNILSDNNKIHIQNSFGDYAPVYVNGIQINIEIIDSSNSPISIDSLFVFNTTGSKFNKDEIQKREIEKINVFPNPYYATHTNENSQYEKFITFSNLPQRAKIRIYNIAGHLVRTIYKDNESQYITWDLTNEHNFWVASGIYLVYIEMPDLMESKILKLALILETIVPHYF